MNISLTDNTRYFLESDDNSSDKTLPEDIFDLLNNLPNPLTTNNLDGVEYIEKKPNQRNINNETLVFKIVKKNNTTYLQTGNMVGEFFYKQNIGHLHKITIKLRFDKSEDNTNNHLLEYLLNYADAIYPDKVQLGIQNNNNSNSNSIIELLLSNLFSHSLLKASVMGLPSIYQEKHENNYNMRGRIDTHRLISQELPFKGKTPSISNERSVIKSIGSVLLRAIEIIQNNKKNSFSFLSPIKSNIQQSGINNIINKNILNDALSHKVLNHPSFSEYRNTLYLANLIIKGFKSPKPSSINGLFYGFLVDISKIWENFLVKLIKQNISDDWEIYTEPQLTLFIDQPNAFGFANVMYPDIIIKHIKEQKIMVFDAKFKSSLWFNREDFYKTATYVSYYQNNNYNVVLCGQIYPDNKLDKINSNIGFLGSDVDFRFFGINMSDFQPKELNQEDFIQSIKNITN